MRTSAELREEIRNLTDEMEAIVDVADRESRDLSDEEAQQIADIADNKIPARRTQLKSIVKIETERKKRAAARFESEIDELQNEGDQASPQSRFSSSKSGLKVPAQARSHKPNLDAYKGPDGERDAYLAGMCYLASRGSAPAIRFCEAHGMGIQANLTTNDNSKGGFIVPDEMQRALVRLREERGVFPRFANRIPMGADIINIPRLLADVTAYWPAEAAEITASDPTLGSAELMARKLACLTKVSSELDEDAVVDVGDMITTSMAYAMADKVDEAGFNGDGTSTYGGITGLKNVLNSAAVQDAASGNDSALTLDLADFEATVGKYPQYPGASPRWFMHSAVFWASAGRLMDAAGGNTTMTLADGPNEMRFLGYPVTFCQVLPSTTGTLASTIVAYFGDLRLGCAYGTRRSVRTEVSVDRYFENDLIGIKTTERIAINCHEDGATIRTRPIVALKTAS